MLPRAPRLPPAAQLAALRRELRLYDPQLLRIPALVVANKTDALSPADAATELDHLRRAQPASIPGDALERCSLRWCEHYIAST